MNRLSRCNIRLLALSLATPWLLLSLAGHAQSGGSSGEPQPCPPIEWLCDEPNHDGGPFGEDPTCTCGPGEWIRADRAPALSPRAPQRSVTSTSENLVNWTTACTREASNGAAAVTIEISGSSTFWHSGTKARVHTANYAGGWRESWRGAFPACPRMLLLSASGFGTLGISAGCAARPGCTASVTCSAAGVATSRGDASASISGQSVQGSVGYNQSDLRTEISGNFGGSFDFWDAQLEGTISTERRWSVKGQGSASGSLSFTVVPDRFYCAFTNLPVMASWSASVVATATVSVDENGTAAAAAGAAIALAVH
ncbi:MAG: hypothetical protein EXS17_02005 [Phycisphaerales bacterium]|nr:hypothetical protein [Phycisphaerales bacterium]